MKDIKINNNNYCKKKVINNRQNQNKSLII